MDKYVLVYKISEDEETDNILESIIQQNSSSDEETDNSQENLKCSEVKLIQKRKKIASLIKKNIKEEIKPSNHVHPLILFGIDNRENWLFTVNMNINMMNLKKLNRISNSPSPLHMFHYLCWKKNKFETSYVADRYEIKDIKKLLWNYKEMYEFKRNQDVIAIIEDHKSPQYVKGYLSFDDKNFEDNRHAIGITECSDVKDSIEIFDINEISLYGKKEMPYYFETENNEYYIFNRNCIINPWDIKTDKLLSLTYLDEEVCKVKHFKVLKRVNGYTKWIVRNNDGTVEHIDLEEYNTPIIYEIEEEEDKLDDYIRISCNTGRKKKFNKVLHYSFEVKDEKIYRNLIPVIKESITLGGIGNELYLDNHLTNITSFEITDINVMINNVKQILLNYIPNLNITINNTGLCIIFNIN